nr:uncharacterized protein LOC133576240 isoform X2 [Nerophis lumbriciformis]
MGQMQRIILPHCVCVSVRETIIGTLTLTILCHGFGQQVCILCPHGFGQRQGQYVFNLCPHGFIWGQVNYKVSMYFVSSWFLSSTMSVFCVLMVLVNYKVSMYFVSWFWSTLCILCPHGFGQLQGQYVCILCHGFGQLQGQYVFCVLMVLVNMYLICVLMVLFGVRSTSRSVCMYFVSWFCSTCMYCPHGFGQLQGQYVFCVLMVLVNMYLICVLMVLVNYLVNMYVFCPHGFGQLQGQYVFCHDFGQLQGQYVFCVLMVFVKYNVSILCPHGFGQHVCILCPRGFGQLQGQYVCILSSWFWSTTRSVFCVLMVLVNMYVFCVLVVLVNYKVSILCPHGFGQHVCILCPRGFGQLQAPLSHN